MKQHREKQINDYLNDSLDPEQATELMNWVAETQENADRFAKACVIDQLTEEAFVENPEIANPSSSDRSRVIPFAATGAAIAAAIVVALFFIRDDGATPNPPGSTNSSFAVIAQSVGAHWEGDSEIASGQKIGSESFQLSKGIVRFDFDHGASMTVEGPANFDIVDANNVFIHSGVATFEMPDPKINFKVQTADTQVLDLGTSFGVNCNLPEGTSICVFEGKVEVEGKLIKEGQAVKTSTKLGIVKCDFKTEVYEKAWPLNSGVLQTSGMMKFVSPGPGLVPGLYEDNDQITVFLERKGVKLQHDIAVDLVDPGEYIRVRHLEDENLKKGMKVDSYLVQLDPIGRIKQKSPEQKSRVGGQITFEKPIVGIIASNQKLVLSDETLGHPNGDYGTLPRGLEPRRGNKQKDHKDTLILAADKRTLILDLHAGSAVDQIRVIVSSKAK